MRSTPSCASSRASATESSIVQPPSAQSVAEMRTKSGSSSGQRVAHRAHHLAQQPHAVLERAAVLVGALVGQRREELVQQVAVRGVQLDDAGTRRLRARTAASAKARTTPRDARLVERARAPGARRRTASRSGATRRPPAVARSDGACRPSHGPRVDALRPACASCMPGTAPCSSTKRAMRASASTCSSFQRPRSCGEMRPSGSTAVASVNTSPAPPTARLPRWTRCQSFAKPSSLEYWHMGETTMRLRSVTPRNFIGWNNNRVMHAALPRHGESQGPLSSRCYGGNTSRGSDRGPRIDESLAPHHLLRRAAQPSAMGQQHLEPHPRFQPSPGTRPGRSGRHGQRRCGSALPVHVKALPVQHVPLVPAAPRPPRASPARPLGSRTPPSSTSVVVTRIEPCTGGS